MKHTTTLVLLLLTATLSIAQEKTGVPNTLDAQYTPAGSGVLTYDKLKQKKENSRNDDDYPGNIIKFTPTLLLRSVAAIQYERNIAEGFSLCASIGYSYNYDKINVTYFTGEDPIQINEPKLEYKEVRAKEILPNILFATGKPHFGFGFKFFSTNDDNRFGYYQLNYDRWGYDATLDFTKMPFLYDNANAQNISNGAPQLPYKAIGSVPLNFTFNSFTLRYGYQIITNTKLKTSHEFYIALGGKLTGYDIVLEDYNPQPAFGSSNANLGYIPINYSSRRIREFNVFADVGYAFGFGFGK